MTAAGLRGGLTSRETASWYLESGRAPCTQREHAISLSRSCPVVEMHSLRHTHWLWHIPWGGVPGHIPPSQVHVMKVGSEMGKARGQKENETRPDWEGTGVHHRPRFVGRGTGVAQGSEVLPLGAPGLEGGPRSDTEREPWRSPGVCDGSPTSFVRWAGRAATWPARAMVGCWGGANADLPLYRNVVEIVDCPPPPGDFGTRNTPSLPCCWGRENPGTWATRRSAEANLLLRALVVPL